MKASSKRYDCKLPDKKLLKSSDCRGQCIQLSKKNYSWGLAVIQESNALSLHKTSGLHTYNTIEWVFYTKQMVKAFKWTVVKIN